MSVTTLDIINLMRTRGRGDPPSALADIFVNPLVRVMNFLSGKMDFARAEQTVDGILSLLGSPTAITQLGILLNEDPAVLTIKLKTALDDIASNYGLTRRAALGASGSALFMRSADPSNALPITIPSGTKVQAPSTNQNYYVSSTVIISSMVFNPTYNRFVASVPIQASSPGIQSNATVGAVSVLTSSIPGINSVTNPTAITGGRDEETDAELGARIKGSLATSNIGTEAGYRAAVLQVANVKDATVIGAGNPLMIRDLGDGGAIDIYIADPMPISISQLADASNVIDIGGLGSGPWSFTPSRQPLIDDAAAVTPTPTDVIKDTNGYGGSVNALDYIEYSSNPTGQLIQFQVNSLVSEVKDYIDDPSRKILGADIMIKEATTTLVDVVFQMAVTSGNSFSVVKGNVEAAVGQAISALNIGQSIELSDVINIITNVPGVDRVTIPFQKFNKETESGYVNIIVALANEALRPGNISANQ